MWAYFSSRVGLLSRSERPRKSVMTSFTSSGWVIGDRWPGPRDLAVLDVRNGLQQALHDGSSRRPGSLPADQQSGDRDTGKIRCFFRQLLLRAEYSSPRLLEIRCTVASDSLRQACSVLRTCLTTQQSPGIQVRSCFPRLLETINNTSLKKHRQTVIFFSPAAG